MLFVVIVSPIVWHLVAPPAAGGGAADRPAPAGRRRVVRRAAADRRQPARRAGAGAGRHVVHRRRRLGHRRRRTAQRRPRQGPRRRRRPPCARASASLRTLLVDIYPASLAQVRGSSPPCTTSPRPPAGTTSSCEVDAADEDDLGHVDPTPGAPGAPGRPGVPAQRRQARRAGDGDRVAPPRRPGDPSSSMSWTTERGSTWSGMRSPTATAATSACSCSRMPHRCRVRCCRCSSAPGAARTGGSAARRRAGRRDA